jgi:hypothetical protein
MTRSVSQRTATLSATMFEIGASALPHLASL